MNKNLLFQEREYDSLRRSILKEYGDCIEWIVKENK